MEKIRIKFEKSKYPIFKIAFWIILICSILLIANIIRINAYVFSFKNLYPSKPLSINLSLNRKMADKFLICFDSYCKTPQANSIIGEAANFAPIYSASFNQTDENFFKTKVKKIYLAYPKETKNIENKIKEIDIYIENNNIKYSPKDLLNLENKTVPIILDNSEEKNEYIIYTLNDNSSYRGILTHLGIIILSLIFNWKFFIVPYAWLFITLLIFTFNKDVFKFSIKTKTIILSSLFTIFAILFLSLYFLFPKEITLKTILKIIQIIISI